MSLCFASLLRKERRYSLVIPFVFQQKSACVTYRINERLDVILFVSYAFFFEIVIIVVIGSPGFQPIDGADNVEGTSPVRVGSEPHNNRRVICTACCFLSSSHVE